MKKLNRQESNELYEYARWYGYDGFCGSFCLPFPKESLKVEMIKRSRRVALFRVKQSVPFSFHVFVVVDFRTKKRICEAIQSTEEPELYDYVLRKIWREALRRERNMERAEMMKEEKKKMTSTEFERLAKEKVEHYMAEKHSVDVHRSDLQVVWMTHCLGHKKCLLWAPSMQEHYAEVTYNAGKDEMYIDIYKKVSNSVVRYVAPSEG